MDPETLETTTTIDENNEEVEEAPIPETIIVKRRGRPAGAKNKARESSTGGTPETVATPVCPHHNLTPCTRR